MKDETCGNDASVGPLVADERINGHGLQHLT